MFAGTSNPFGLQSRQTKPLSPHTFGTCSLKYVPRVLKPHTNSHYVMPQCDGLTCLQNGQIRGLQDLHMLAEAFRANSRSQSTFLDSRRSLTQLQSAGAAKGISPPICLAVGPHRPPRELEAVGYPWGSPLWGSVGLEEPQKLFVFGPLTIDSSLGESLFRGSSRPCLFVVSTPPARPVTHLGGYLWGGQYVVVLLFTHPSIPSTIYPASLWGSYWPGGVKSCCLLLFY